MRRAIFLAFAVISALGGTPASAATTLTGPSIQAAARPTFTDLSGSAACAQLPALTGAITTTAGSCATSRNRAIATTAPVNPAGTTSTTGVMMGLAGAITPLVSGTVLFMINGDITNNTKADGANAQLRVSSVAGQAAPANGAALTGSTVGGLVNFTVSGGTAGSGKAPFVVMGYLTGLTIGSSYWYDVGLAAVTGGTASIGDINMVAVEQ